MRSGGRGAGWLAVVLLVAGALAGCGDDPPAPSGPGPRPGPIPAGGLLAVCDGAFYPDDAPYQGPGPHPTQVYWLGEADGSPLGMFSRLLDKSAEDTQPWGAWAEGDVADIQLVACETAGSLTPTGARCEMHAAPGGVLLGGGYQNLAMRAQSVVLTVYEVRTGRTVAQVPLDPSYECPAEYRLRSGQEWLIVKPSAKQVQTSLLPYVTADLPAASSGTGG